MGKIRKLLSDFSYFLNLRYQVTVVACSRVSPKIRTLFYALDSAWTIGALAFIGYSWSGWVGMFIGTTIAAAIQAAFIISMERDVAESRRQIKKMYEWYNTPSDREEPHHDDTK